MVTMKVIRFDTNVGRLTIRLKLHEDHSIQYVVYLASDLNGYGLNWKDGVKDNKAETAKLIINQLESENNIEIMESHWKTTILDTILPTDFPHYIPKTCHNCRYCVCVLGDENNLLCERFNESLNGCDVDDDGGCDFFEESEWC